MSTAFSLSDGQVSNIICSEGMYYIIKCTDGYAEEETKERKDRLEKAMNSRAVADVLEPYQNEHKIQFMDRFWNDLDFENENSSTVESFFDIFNKYL